MKIGRWITVAVIAAALRLPQLEIRPMHGDEAVMAVKAGALTFGGEGSAYDPTGYHGTLLGWMARPVLMLTGAKSLADTDERHFRLVTAVCGILLCLTPLLLADGLGTNGALIAGLLLAVSPAFVYWSRFYIQEVPLVLATALCLGCGWRFARSMKTGWLWGAAVPAGLMLSLKETAWLSFMAGGVGLAAVKPARVWIGTHWTRLVGPAVAALAIPALILGPAALLAPLHYWNLGITGGDHAHPWHWYFSEILNPWKDSVTWLPFMLTVIVPHALTRPLWPLAGSRTFGAFLAWYFAALAVEYCALPYKTPWCILGFGYAGLLLAGMGVEWSWRELARWRRDLQHPAMERTLDLASIPLFVVLFSHQAWVWSFQQAADRRNPFVYAQPVEDVRRLGGLVGRISAVHPQGREMLIAVSAGNPWPLPWELRGFRNVAYLTPGDPLPAAMWPVAVWIRRATPDGPGPMFGIRPGEIVELQADPALLRRALRD